MGDTQRLTDTEQLEILALLEAASTEHSAMRAARALAELMRHLHALGLRIAVELPDQDRDGKPAGRLAHRATAQVPGDSPDTASS
jgi:hypothetical protein